MTTISLVPPAANATPIVFPSNRDRFDAFYSEWLKLRGGLHDPRDKRTNARQVAASCRVDELAILITTTPAETVCRLQTKLEVLRHHMTETHGEDRLQRPELIMLAGIDADMTRFKLGVFR